MTEEDDDWFERALTEQDDREDGTDADADEAPTTGDGDATDPSAEEAGDQDDGGKSAGGTADQDDAAVSVDGEGTATDSGVATDESGGDEELFEDDFASAFEGPDDVFDGSPRDEDAFDGSDGPFGGGSGAGESPFVGGGDGGPFAGNGVGEFGTGGGSDTDFSDDALDSELDRIDLGIGGLDEMIRGGVPTSSLMAIVGSAGTGKTTFGLQFLEQGLSNGEKTIYITLEEGRERVIHSAEEKGWPFREYAEEGRLAVVDIDPIEMANSLSSIRSELPRLIDRFEASRLVLDSVSLLEMMYDDRATRRNEIYTFARSLKEAGVTVLLTSEASEDNPYASRHGIVEYLTDAVYVLQYVRPSDFQETRLAVEIQKIRDAHHSREMKPYEITDSGISVYRQANIF